MLPRATACMLALAATASLLAPTASAGMDGEITYNLVSLDELQVDVELTFTGETARDAREDADEDGDGIVDRSELAEIEDDLNEDGDGPWMETQLDGNDPTDGSQRGEVRGILGPTDTGSPVRIVIASEASLRPGPGPEHTFEIDSLWFPGSDQVSVSVLIPEGTTMEETYGAEQTSTCEATVDQGDPESWAEVSFSEGGEGCVDKGTPGPGVLPVLAAFAVVALATHRSRAGL